ncbi:MFS transporter [Actinoplanes sp. NPDC051861]|uniref:MFS transporter n=1 Tax=Actinoplanes sp. NPDC051861 TaxID=3155170 RepID=UPI003429713F
MTAVLKAKPGFWAIAFAFLVAMAFSTVPTPLYPLYMARDGFSTFTVTVVFAVYAAGVVVSLLLAGHVSDRIGRKRILVPALALELVAALLFLSSTSLPVLLTARFLTGLGVGMITATATAYLQELHTLHRPGASRQRFEVVSTAANSGGLGLGTLVAGFLAQFVEAPLRTPYAIFVLLLSVSLLAVVRTPETVPPQAGTYRWRPQRIGMHGDRVTYLAAAAGAFASFAVFGVFTSLAPGFVAGTLHHPSRLLAGAVVFAVFGSAAVAQTLTGRLGATARTRLGLLAQTGGILVPGRRHAHGEPDGVPDRRGGRGCGRRCAVQGGARIGGGECGTRATRRGAGGPVPDRLPRPRCAGDRPRSGHPRAARGRGDDVVRGRADPAAGGGRPAVANGQSR